MKKKYDQNTHIEGDSLLKEAPFIEVKNLSFSYSKESPLMDNLSFSIKKGSRTLLLGGNGSGKSTLAKLLCGLLKPDRGTISVNGLAHLGYLFQNPSWQIVSSLVEDDVAFGLENQNIKQNKIVEIVDASLKDCDISHLKGRETHKLSQGQQQRLALAGVLAISPECIILDEAASMLNPLGRQKFEELLDRLHSAGHTIIQITHFMNSLYKADSLLILNQGTLVYQGGASLKNFGAKQLKAWNLLLPHGIHFIQRLLDDQESKELESLALEGGDQVLLDQLQRLSVEGKQKVFDFLQIHEKSFHPLSQKSDESIIRFKNVVKLSPKTLKGQQKTILKNISFTIKKGESVAFMGRTGAGKSTLMQMMNALLLPDRGELSLLGINPLDKKSDLRTLRQKIGLVMQQPERQLFASYVGDDIAYGPSIMGFTGKDLSRRVKRAMERMGLDFNRYKDRSIKALSGGEKRKVALAGILAMEPEVLLLDEPTAGLDPLSSLELRSIFKTLEEKGLTLIYISHDEEFVKQVTERIIVLKEGEIVFNGTKDNLFYKGDLESFGLTKPLSYRVREALHE